MSMYRTGVSSSYGDDARDSMPAPKERAGLVLLYASNFEQLSPAYVFVSPELTIGRDASNLICVPEQAVSRQHARIYAKDDRWFLQDLGSRNGTMVDGAYVTEIELEPNHEIRIGDAIFKFVDAGVEKCVAYRIDGRVAGDRKAKLFTELVGGAQIDHIAADIERIAPTELSAVILGETGTGKEVVARGIHRLSGRRGSLQAINCAAIPHNLLESELFGYRRGAFSGADRDKPGLIKLADQGTLFLDEIGDMPLDAQAKLLRVLQSHEVFPLGATTPERVDIRVVCATHRDLYQYVKEGKFRGDLLARLNEHVVRLPPLRERKEDIFLLARTFGARYGRPNLELSFSFIVALLHYDWPFNVRELESCIKRAVALTDGAQLDSVHLPDAIAEHMKGYGARPRPSASNPYTAPTTPSGVSTIPPPMPPGQTPWQPSYAPWPAQPYASQGPHGPPVPYEQPPYGAPPPVHAPRPSAVPPMPRRTAPTEEELRALLQRHRGNVAAVGRELGKERMQVHRWLKRYKIDLSQYR
jgi:transcriptional regulator with GAF, ATPase, and Fis domain